MPSIVPIALKRGLARLTATSRFSPRLEVVRVDIKIPELPAVLDGFRLGQLSDFHVGEGYWGPMRLTEASAALQAEGVDLYVNTGDFVYREPPLPGVLAAVRQSIQPFESGPARLNVAILGNHDYYAGEPLVSELSDAVRALGICLLRNQVCVQTHRGAPITLGGLSAAEPAFDATVKQLVASPRPRIVLIHEPDLVERLPSNCADLILAGHTHGGQIALPLLTSWIVRHACGSNYVSGSYWVNGNLMYINRGLGYTGYPIRFRATPELTLLRLVR